MTESINWIGSIFLDRIYQFWPNCACVCVNMFHQRLVSLRNLTFNWPGMTTLDILFQKSTPWTKQHRTCCVVAVKEISKLFSSCMGWRLKATIPKRFHVLKAFNPNAKMRCGSYFIVQWSLQDFSRACAIKKHRCNLECSFGDTLKGHRNKEGRSETGHLVGLVSFSFFSPPCFFFPVPFWDFLGLATFSTRLAPMAKYFGKPGETLVSCCK